MEIERHKVEIISLDNDFINPEPNRALIACIQFRLSYFKLCSEFGASLSGLHRILYACM